MKTPFVLVASLFVAFSLSIAFAAEVKLDDAKCPISGKAVVDGTGVAHNGGQVYFCCPNCPKAFAKNPAKFATKANAQLVTTGQAKQVACPISGKDLNPETAIEVAGNQVAFCCPNCKGKVESATGDAQLDLVYGEKPFAKGFEVAAEKE